MSKSSFITVPLPLISMHENGVTFCLRDWNLFLIILGAFALGWIASKLKDHYLGEE
jgi:hypothetical protein